MSLDNYAQIIGRFARYPLAKIIPPSPAGVQFE